MLQPNTTYKPNGEYYVYAVRGEGHCDLCGTAVKYHYGIANENGDVQYVGSDCIIKFEIVSPFTGEKYHDPEQLRMDMVKMTIDKFIEKGASKEFFSSLRQEVYLSKGHSPKQLIAIENTAIAFGIVYDVGWFKLNLKSDKNKAQMEELKKHRNWENLKYALSPAQLKKFDV